MLLQVQGIVAVFGKTMHVLVMLVFVFVHATERAWAEESVVGAVTKQPIPRFVSQKYETMHVRRGPGYEYMIDWQYQRQGTPLKLTREFQQWRMVEDAEGIGGWVHQSQIIGTKTVQVLQDASMHIRRGENMPLVAQVEQGAILKVMECDENWCRLKSAGYKGWIAKNRLWGAIDIEK